MWRFLQNHPHFLERVYGATERAIRPFQRWLKPDGRLEPLIIFAEEIGKGAVFDCRMCGQCVLHSTGMTCPMTCPKNLRNGPCGGVRPNGRCEVKPEMLCVWVQAYERSLQMPEYGTDMLRIQPPVNRRLTGTSSWVNMLAGVDTVTPKGWAVIREIMVTMP
ncbi:MAG TPA: hypothetical protein ENJ93_04800 [Chloroflexi bacterium]|nr:hypothetical protein [Chloroflexota bacterium]